MPELDLFQTEDDELVFISKVLASGGWLVPDIRSASPNVQHIESESEFLQFRKETRYFYILHKDYLRCDLVVRKLPEKELHYIVQRDGGPTIDYLGGGAFMKGSVEWVRPGGLSHYPSYWNPVASRNEKPPDELVVYYKSLVGFLKNRCKRIKPGKRVYWVDRNALEKIRRGAALVGLENFPTNELNLSP